MTDKEFVLKVYPDAQTIIYNKEYCILASDPMYRELGYLVPILLCRTDSDENPEEDEDYAWKWAKGIIVRDINKGKKDLTSKTSVTSLRTYLKPNNSPIFKDEDTRRKFDINHFEDYL